MRPVPGTGILTPLNELHGNSMGNARNDYRPLIISFLEWECVLLEYPFTFTLLTGSLILNADNFRIIC